MKIKNMVALASLSLLFACSQTIAPETQYYLLNSADASLANINTAVVNKSEVEVNLPEYLKQPYLVMQTGEHQLHYAHHHMWAQSLNYSIKQVLRNHLLDRNVKLVLDIEHFHATEQGKVLFIGTLNYMDLHTGEASGAKGFKLEQKLNQDGYAEVVKVMKSLLITLISQQVEG